ncbi:MAG: exodeoxyribonuclease VII large subunit [Bacilli bacterium]|nr:exodeoxyribonuclease VII large subunit [Bacilli bacterium]
MNQVNYLTITQLSRYLKYKFDEDVNLKRVYLKGEISNFKAHTRGHYYFTLKDENSRINAVMFQSNALKIKFLPQDGMKVMVNGRVSVYEASGGYQIYVDDMLEDGVGNLYIAYEQLKKKLESEGLFAKEHKKKIVKMPKRIGIVTAPTGAAIRDILTTIRRRYPIVETILFPALVQGEYAASDIAKKINIAQGYDIDTLIVGRGGGSIEDLWPFNEEIVARAIYNSRIPVISAVGHEVDFTIADFVADLRAPTPTAAAELAVVDINTVRDYLNTVKTRSYNAISNIISKYRDRINNINDSYVIKKPSNIYEVKEQKLDMLIDRINGDINKIIEVNKIRLFKYQEHYILNNPRLLYMTKEDKLVNITDKINKEMGIIYKFKKQKLDNIVSKLTVLNPLSTISRGYSVTRYNNKVIDSVKNIKKNDLISIELKDGIFDAMVERISDK